jgi:hypothetical protein
MSMPTQQPVMLHTMKWISGAAWLRTSIKKKKIWRD